MKTILYNPIFINPQAYYVFPRLTRYLQPDNESTSEPANYIGTIEVKVIAYGDTTLKRTYTNTDSIDLSEFKNTWIRISLFTKVGSCVLGEWKIGNMESDLPYIDPEVLASLKAVVIVGNKTNNDSDRAIVKNLVDPDNPFVIGNAAFKLNSGFGKYEEDFTDWKKSPKVTSFDGESIKFTSDVSWVLLYHPSSIGEDIPSFKVRIKLYGEGALYYSYITQEGKYTSVAIKSEIFETPICYNTKYTGEKGVNVGFTLGVRSGECSGTITQIPSFQGALVTDGVDDLITSTKTTQEMLGGSNEITVVSMINTITPYRLQLSYTNAFPINGTNKAPLRNEVSNTGKTGIYGYTYKNNVVSVINNVLGDKNDYTAGITGEPQVDDRFEVTRTKFNSSVAWYWTFIAKKALTTDQINQVIAYFNLDRTLKPDILCNIEKQGITNENHAEFGDKLIDFSGNGRDIQLNNIAWDGDSGIGKYNYPNWKVTATIANTYSTIVNYPTVNGTYSINVNGVSELMQSIGLHLEIKYTTSKGIIYNDIKQDGVYSYILPDGATNLTLRFGGIPGIVNEPCNITITQIPSHAGALCLDGVNDFGKVTGLPIYKDYTVIADYERTDIGNIEGVGTSPVLSKSYTARQGSFIMNFIASTGNSIRSYSFGTENTSNFNDLARQIFYQSKYKNQGFDITAGTGVDGDSLWLGTARDNDSRFFNGAIYSLMSFPYSMSEFLIERQLKKHKLGTLYPDMVEFRPIVKSNSEYQVVNCYIDTLPAVVGNYYPINSKLRIAVTTKGAADEVTSLTVNGVSLGTPSVNGNRFTFNGTLSDKSPQKINITIDEYIRFEDIVQPYPVLLRFKDENGNEVSWGGKFRVGSTITRIGSIADPESNLLNGLYSVSGLSLNGKAVTSSTSIVEKQMVFKTTATWLLDNNTPKCILSPSRLRIPNSSYKILGYIPDISGHGNHGVIHNSAYAEGSGVNEDGSYQFDGVDDFVTIPTVTGGKQVLMKVNWQSYVGAVTLYDQRLNLPDYEFAIYNGTRDLDDNPVMAYQGRNNGQTYIDGILNSNIMASELKAITHNITITNELSLGTNNTYPVIGSTRSNTHFAQMSLYDFMLFDDISTDDKIKELNEYVGIEAKVELPPYYWDAYGKTNLDADKATIQQRGVAVGDYDITNYNHAYDKMSGYGGYAFAKFDNTTEWTTRNREDGIEIIKRNGYSFTAKRIGTGQYFYDFQNRSTTVLNKSLTVKAVSNNNTYIRWEYKYRTAEKPDVDSTLYLVRQAMTPNVPITVTLPYKTEQEKADLGVTEGSDSYLFYFDPSDIPVGDEYTVEMLPLYTNGLVYDGIADYSKNANIPALDDFTAIIKRQFLKKQGSPLIKGSKVYEGGNGNALLLEWDKAYNFVFYKRTDIMEGELPDNISFITPTNYNGNVITRGSEQDTNGICIAGDGNAGFANMVFYKLMLYPKTIPLLQINFLKNLMERDEIIDLNNKIFIQE